MDEIALQEYLLSEWLGMDPITIHRNIRDVSDGRMTASDLLHSILERNGYLFATDAWEILDMLGLIKTSEHDGLEDILICVGEFGQ